MLRAMSCGVAGIDTHQNAMGVVGNNISNVNTYGFKSSSAAFTDVMYQTLSNASAPGVSNGGKDPVQVGYGSKTGTISVNTTKGDEASTGNSSDLYIDGEGYFTLANQLPSGTTTPGIGTQPDSYKYTRVGAMKFDSSGNLVDTATGSYVCGMNSLASGATDTTLPTSVPTSPDWTKAETKPEVIHYDTTNTKNTLKDVAISADGTITATNSAGSAVYVGKLELAHFANPAGLSQDGSSCLSVSDNSGTPSYNFAGSGATGSLVTGALEASNVDLATELSNMIVYERGFQANSKIITVSDEMLETLVNMKR